MSSLNMRKGAALDVEAQREAPFGRSKMGIGKFHPDVELGRDGTSRRMASSPRMSNSRPSGFEAITDKFALLLFLGCLGGLAFFVGDTLTAEAPERYLCTRYPCEDARGTYYVQDDDISVLDPCAVYPQPKAANCKRKQSLYAEVTTSNAGLLYLSAALMPLIMSVAVQYIGYASVENFVDGAHLFVNIGLWAGFGVSVSFLSFWAIFWGVLAVGHSLYFAASRFRFEGALPVIAFTTDFYYQNAMLQMLSYLTIVVQSVLFLGWAYIFVRNDSRHGPWIDFLVILGYLWVNQTIRNLAHAATSGVFGSWYFTKSNSGSKSKRVGYQLAIYKRAATIHLGSVAYSAAFMSLAKTVRVVYGVMRNSASGFAAILAVAALVFEYLLSAFNMYGVCQVMMYGRPYMESAANAYLLMIESGVRIMMVDDVIVVLNYALALLSGAGCVLMAWVLTYTDVVVVEGVNNFVVVYLPCFIIGLIGGIAILDTIESITAALYTCFAEEPQMLEGNDEELYLELMDAWFDAQDEEFGLEDDSDGEGASDISYSDSESESDDDMPSRRTRRTQLTGGEEGTKVVKGRRFSLTGRRSSING